MSNLTEMMQKAKDMQEKLVTAKEELAQMRFTGEGGSGSVKVEVDGRGHIQSVKLSPEAVNCKDDDDRAMLEDLVVVAMEDARKQADAAKLEKMKDLTGGVPMPPGFEMPL